MENQTLSISICESAITIGRVEVADGRLACQHYNSYAVNNWVSVQEVIKQWSSAIKVFANGVGFETLAIAMPGPFDYEKGIFHIKENRNLKSLYGQNLKTLLASELNITEQNIDFYNDAVCALAAEPLPSKKRILGLYFDEGFGSAWLHEEEIIDAQLWNQPFSGQKAEDYFSIKWLRKAYFELTGLSIASINDLNDFSSITGKELLKEFTENLANYMKDLMRENPFDGLLLGGSMLSKKINILVPLKKRLSSMGLQLDIFKSDLGNHAPLIGTAILNRKKYENKIINQADRIL